MDPVIKRITAQVDKAKTKDLGDGIVEVVVTTGSKDRHGEKLDLNGLDTKNYSGVVLWGHDYDSPPIGKSVYLRKKDGQLISRTQFAVNEYPFAHTVYKLVKGGFAPDVSIGFIPKAFDEETMTWTEAEMIEYSHVTIGANVDAKVTSKSLKEIGVSQKEFAQQYKDHMLKVKALEADLLGDDPVTEKLANDEDTRHNVLNHLAAIKSMVSAAESEIEDLDSHDTEPTKTQTKRIILVRTKKTVQSIDRIAELAIGHLNKQLTKED